jgi:jouberin
VPSWEELLVFNEDFEYILRNDPPVLILFEVLDFVNFTVASSNYQKFGKCSPVSGDGV